MMINNKIIILIISIIILIISVVVESKISFVDEFSSSSGSFENDGTIIETTNGYTQGLIHEQYKSWYGIPFATPPTVENNLRWKAPIESESWSPKILNASIAQPGCIQKCELPPMNCPTEISEDCLYLNVFTPLDVANPNVNTNDLRPVMFYIAGGRFEQGVGSSLLYTPELMVNTSGIIVVTFNYRLGVTGFLISDQVDGNFGFLDQRLAMEWVQNNIKNFGGDPQKITLVGQSAGATSIATHLTAKQSFGLFHSVIVQSNPFTLGLKTNELARKFSDNFGKGVNCSTDNLQCLYALTTDQIIQGQIIAQAKLDPLEPLASFLPWTPTIGCNDIEDQPLTLLEKGDFYDVPMIIGTVSEEALLFIYQASPKNVSEFDYGLVVDLIFLENEYIVKEDYPPYTNGSDNRPVLSVLGTNYIFACSTRYAIELLLQFKKTPVYLYQFSHVMSFNPWGPNYPYCNHHCCHGSELVFEFNAASRGGFNFTDDEQQLAYNINGYWTNFVNSADPNTGLSVPVPWPAYESSNIQSMQLTTPNPYIVEGLLETQCNSFDKIGYSSR